MHTRLIALVLAAVVTLSAPAPAVARGDLSKDLRDIVELGMPEPASISWSEMLVEVPVRLRPVGVGGRVHRLEFHELSLNGIPFEVDPYDASFDLPSKKPVALPQPLRLRLRFRTVAPKLLEEALAPSASLRLSGRVTIDGTFKKWIFSSRRTVELPVEVSGANPFADYHPLQLAIEELKRLEQKGWRLPF